MANWKMNGNREMVRDYISRLNQYSFASTTELVIFPPVIFLPEFEKNAKSKQYSWGGQNIYAEDKGAFTGEIAISMLKEYGCKYALIGHSERRHIFKEGENLIAKKFNLTKEYGMIPVVCVGESLKEYKNKQTKEIIKHQLKSLKINDAFSFEKSIIAYEPVWAIGTGLTPSLDEIRQVFIDIKMILREIDVYSTQVPLLYGGSVTAKNIKDINEIKEGQGVLVGGASLNIEQLLEITQCTVCC
jgi:triosephosphate isomerase